jgi:hypothetical protein
MSDINISVYPLGKDSQVICREVISELKSVKCCYNYSENGQLTSEQYRSFESSIKEELLNCDLLILVSNLNYPSEQRKVMMILDIAEQLTIVTVVFSIKPILLLNWLSKIYFRSGVYKEDREVGALDQNFQKIISKTALIQLKSGLSYIDCIDYNVNDFYLNIDPIYCIDFTNYKHQDKKQILENFYSRTHKEIELAPLTIHYLSEGFNDLSTRLILAIRSITEPIVEQELIGIDFANYRLAFNNKGLYQTKHFTQKELLKAKKSNERWLSASVIIVTVFLKVEHAIDVFSQISTTISILLERDKPLWLCAAVIDEQVRDEPIITVIYKP